MPAKKLTDVGFVFFFDWSDALSALPPEDFKALLLATAAYAQGGDAPTALSPAAQMAFHFISTSIERWHEKSDARAESGKRGAAVTNAKKAGDAQQSAAKVGEGQKTAANDGYHPHPHPHPEIDPHTDLDPHPHPHPSPARAHGDARIDAPAARGGGGESSGGFEKFWEAYPRKLKKSDARLAWAVLAPDDALAERIVNVVRYLERGPDWKRDDGRFIPLPAKFLEERRFDDVGEVEPDPWATFGC